MLTSHINKLSLALLVVSSYCSFISSTEIRHITPPKLELHNLGQEIICHRPMRRGQPKIEIEYRDNKIVAHNYGHGGSGWTLGPGSASYSINLLEQSNHASSFTKDTPITIIGAGAIGLFSAYELVQRGYTNITIIAKEFDNLTSHNAGGLLAPVSMDNSPEMQTVIDKIGIDAYIFYAAIANKTNYSELHGGAYVVPTYFQTREESGLEPYVGVVMQPAKDVVLDFGNGTQQEMVVYDDGIFIDTAKLMVGLTEYLKPFVTFVQQEVTDFNQIADDYLINCTGLGSATLNNDDQLVSVQGHLIMLKDQNPDDLQYMLLLYLVCEAGPKGEVVKRSFYIFPKRMLNADAHDVGVIGGTFIEGADSSNPHTQEFDIIKQNAKKFYGIN